MPLGPPSPGGYFVSCSQPEVGEEKRGGIRWYVMVKLIKPIVCKGIYNNLKNRPKPLERFTTPQLQLRQTNSTSPTW
jgi:hypothetical protein